MGNNVHWDIIVKCAIIISQWKTYLPQARITHREVKTSARVKREVVGSNPVRVACEVFSQTLSIYCYTHVDVGQKINQLFITRRAATNWGEGTMIFLSQIFDSTIAVPNIQNVQFYYGDRRY